MPDLTPIEREIINYLKDYAGSSKADIIRHIRNKQMGSRMTVLEYIKDLENKNMIFGEKERPDSQSYKMYINERNELLNMITILEELRESFTILLRKSKEIIDSIDFSQDARELGIAETDPSKWSEEDKKRYAELQYTKSEILDEKLRDALPFKPDNPEYFTTLKDIIRKRGANAYILAHGLAFSPTRLFYMVVDLVFFRGMILWPHKIEDKDNDKDKDGEDLAEMYSVIYKKIADIQLELSKFTESIIAIKFHYPSTQMLVDARYLEMIPRYIQRIITWYRNLGMGLEIHRIVYQLVRLNKGLENLKIFELDALSVKELGYNQ